MCLQCVTLALSYETPEKCYVLPGFSLMQAIRDDDGWRAGQWGLVQINDPDVTFYGRLIHSRDATNEPKQEERHKTVLNLLEAMNHMYFGNAVELYLAVKERTGKDYTTIGTKFNPHNHSKFVIAGDFADDLVDVLADWVKTHPPVQHHDAIEDVNVEPKQVKMFFNYCRNQWVDDTRLLSSPTRMAEHPAYRAVVAMGKVAIPLIIDDLRKGPMHWFIALRELTGANPVPEEHAGRMHEIAKDWIDWWDKKSK